MPSHRMGDRQRERIEAEDRREYERKLTAAHRRAVNAARKAVAIWNRRQKAGVELWFYPTIDADGCRELEWALHTTGVGNGSYNRG